MQFKGLVLILSTVSLFACSSSPKLQSQVSGNSGNIEIIKKGFSLLIPNQDNWKVVKKGPYNVVLSKQGLTNKERYTIQALVVKLPRFSNDEEFMAFIKERMKKTQQKSDSKIIEHHTQFVDGEDSKCVQYRSKKQYPDKSKAVMIETVNFTCRHADRDNAGVYLAYSKKYLGDNEDKDFAESAAGLFNQMELSAL